MNTIKNVFGSDFPIHVAEEILTTAIVDEKERNLLQKGLSSARQTLVRLLGPSVAEMVYLASPEDLKALATWATALVNSTPYYVSGNFARNAKAKEALQRWADSREEKSSRKPRRKISIMRFSIAGMSWEDGYSYDMIFGGNSSIREDAARLDVMVQRTKCGWEECIIVHYPDDTWEWLIPDHLRKVEPHNAIMHYSVSGPHIKEWSDFGEALIEREWNTRWNDHDRKLAPFAALERAAWVRDRAWH